MKKYILILFVILTLKGESQEIGISGFYQADLMYDARPGITINYIQKINNVFSISVSSDYQYITSPYTTYSFIGPGGYIYYNKPKLNMTNLGISFFLTLAETEKVNFLLGSRPSVYYILGNISVHEERDEYNYETGETENTIEKNYRRYTKFFKYGYTNDFLFQIKKTFIPHTSFNFKLSTGYIFEGSRQTGCLLSFFDIYAPQIKICAGLSYKFK